MTLLRFIDCATTMLYEEFQRVGQDVFEAFESTRRWAAGTLVAAPDEQGVYRVEQKPPPPEVSAAQNDRSLAQFTAMLSGAGGMPG